MTREAVVAEALDWIGTPFHDAAGVKGVGTDCLHFVKCVYARTGLIPDFVIPPYKPQWFLNQDEPLFLNGLAKYAHQVDVAQPGDIAMFNFGRHAAHSAIVVDDITLVHAYQPVGCVTLDSRADHAHRLHSYWSFF